MERLTKRIGNSVVYSEFNSNNSDGCYEMMNNCLHKLAEYEDCEEQGLLLRLPVAIGSEVWKIVNQRDNFTDIPYKIITIVHFRLDMLKEIGKIVFLTKEEAEQALAEIKEV